MKPLPPIYSTHDEDLSMRDAIEGFVIGLAERIDDLQDAELQGNLKQVGELCTGLVAEASATGYPALVEAGELVLSAESSGGPKAVLKALFELTETVQRVRRGSRSAS
jgi:hypothetical protein